MRRALIRNQEMPPVANRPTVRLDLYFRLLKTSAARDSSPVSFITIAPQMNDIVTDLSAHGAIPGFSTSVRQLFITPLVVGEILSELHQLRHYVKEPAGGPASLKAI
jgi:hypothetical protein